MKLVSYRRYQNYLESIKAILDLKTRTWGGVRAVENYITDDVNKNGLHTILICFKLIS